MKINAERAKRYFQHPSQRRNDLDPESLTDNMEYRALGGVCMVFHMSHWWNVWMIHIGVKPEAWGCVDSKVYPILADFAADNHVERFIAWIEHGNRLACKLAERCGFELDGEMPTAKGKIMMYGRKI